MAREEIVSSPAQQAQPTVEVALPEPSPEVDVELAANVVDALVEPSASGVDALDEGAYLGWLEMIGHAGDPSAACLGDRCCGFVNRLGNFGEREHCPLLRHRPNGDFLPYSGRTVVDTVTDDVKSLRS